MDEKTKQLIEKCTMAAIGLALLFTGIFAFTETSSKNMLITMGAVLLSSAFGLQLANSIPHLVAEAKSLKVSQTAQTDPEAFIKKIQSEYNAFVSRLKELEEAQMNAIEKKSTKQEEQPEPLSINEKLIKEETTKEGLEELFPFLTGKS